MTQARWGARAIASLIVFIIATLLTPVAIVGHWGHQTVVDAEQYINTVGPLIDQEEVQLAVADAVSTAVIDQVDTASLVNQLLGSIVDNPQLTTMLGVPITAGVNNLIREASVQVVGSDAFRQLWLTTNQLAQRSLIRLLEGDPEGIVKVSGDEIVIDISNLLAAGQQQLVERGLTAAGNVTIPQVNRQIPIASAGALPQLQFIYALASPLLRWFPLVLTALFGLAIALSRNRARTVMATGIALVVVTVLTRLGLGTAELAFVTQMRGTVFGPAAEVFWATFFNYLIAGLDAAILLGVIVALAGWFGGRSRPATQARTSVSEALHRAGSGLSPELRRQVRAYTPVLRWAIVIAMGLCLAFQSPITMWDVTWISVVVLLGFIVVEVLSGPDRMDAIEAPVAEEAGAI